MKVYNNIHKQQELLERGEADRGEWVKVGFVVLT